jgi:hypothetical protein
MRKILYIVVILALACPAWAATYYASPSGSGTTCSEGSPCTLTYAVETKADDGNTNTVHLQDGSYGISSTLDVPDKVSLTADVKSPIVTLDGSYDVQTVHLDARIYPTADFHSTPMIKLSSTSNSADHTGNSQTISYIELDGIDGSNEAYYGIVIENRDNVRITQCYLHDIINASVGTRAPIIRVIGTGAGSGLDWWNYWPDNVGADGVDTTIDALWPDYPVDSFQLDNCYIYDGASQLATGGGLWKYASVELLNLKDSTIHDNVFDNRTSKGQFIAGADDKEAFLDNVDIYNNIGRFGSQVQGVTNFTTEIWVMKGGCEFYNNTMQGWLSITVGKNTDIYDNVITMPDYQYSKGIAIEFNKQSYGEVTGNYIEKARWGIVVGHTGEDNDGQTTTDVLVARNVTHETNARAIYVECLGKKGAYAETYVNNINVYNNVIDTITQVDYPLRVSDYDYAQNPTTYTGYCTLNNVNIKNNLIINGTGWAGSTAGTPSNITIDHNFFYANGTNDWENETDTNTSTGTVLDDLNLQEVGSGYDGYTPMTGSDLIDAGTDIGLSYNGGAPDVGAIETGGAAFPVIGNYDPTQGEVLDAGTTAYNMEIDCTHADGCTGCKADTDGSEAYADMANAMVSQGSCGTNCTTWRHALSGLANDTSYTWYFRCTDGVTPNTSDATLNFEVEDAAGTEDIICDNSDACYSENGTWATSTSIAGYYGSNYRHNGADADTDYATFNPTLSESGSYNVYVRWVSPESGYRSDSVQIDVVHSGGTAETTVDQTQNSGAWVSVGTYDFTAGSGGSIQVGGTGSGGDTYYIVADAARWELVDEEPPAPPNPGTGTITIDTTATGSVTVSP